jgi:AcrR family transcriptional regulator
MRKNLGNNKRSYSSDVARASRPIGKTNVTAAVISAAGELFSRHGFDGVSIRDIAKKARVNHGLIHRHFGSKENLWQKTLQTMADAMLADVVGTRNLNELLQKSFQSLKKHENFWRILARTILDGYNTGNMHDRYPIARLLIERVTAEIEAGALREDIDPKILVAIMFSFSCGFIMYDPFILAATGLDCINPVEAREKILSAALTLIGSGMNSSN